MALQGEARRGCNGELHGGHSHTGHFFGAATRRADQEMVTAGIFRESAKTIAAAERQAMDQSALFQSFQRAVEAHSVRPLSRSRRLPQER